MPRLGWVVGLLLVGLVAAGCSSAGGGPTPPTTSGAPGTMTVTSTALHHGKPMSPPYGCAKSGDRGTSPPLSWSGAPSGTKAYAVTIVDPDAHDFLHWGLLDLPADTTSLPRGASSSGQLPAGAKELTNGFGDRGYGAPCPPSGQTHHYVVTVWALRSPVASLAGIAKDALAHGTLTVTYGR